MRVGVAVVCLAACGRVGFEPTTSPTDGASDSGDSGGTAPIAVQAAPPNYVNAATSQTTFARPVTAGNLIVVYAWTFSQGTGTLPVGATHDDAGTSYLQAVTAIAGNCAGGYASAAIYYGVATAATAATVTVTAPNANSELGLAAVEYANVATLVDVAQKETAGTASPLVFESGAVTTSGPALLASVATECAGYPDPIMWSESQGFAALIEQGITFNLPPGFAGDRLVASAGMYRGAWTVDYTAGPPFPALAVIAAFE